MKTSGYFDIVAELPGRGRAATRRAGAGRRAVRGDHPGRLHAASCCAASARRCWSRPMRPIPAAAGAALAAVRELAASVAREGPQRPARRRCAGGDGAVRGARAPALQPRRRSPQHNIVPGPDGRDPHHDHGDDDRPRDDARARARHDGEPARDAGAAARGDDRQDRALHRHRPGPGRPIILLARALPVRRADRRQPRRALRRGAASSSPPTSRSASRSRRSRRTSCRRCR